MIAPTTRYTLSHLPRRSTSRCFVNRISKIFSVRHTHGITIMTMYIVKPVISIFIVMMRSKLKIFSSFSKVANQITGFNCARFWQQRLKDIALSFRNVSPLERISHCLHVQHTFRHGQTFKGLKRRALFTKCFLHRYWSVLAQRWAGLAYFVRVCVPRGVAFDPARLRQVKRPFLTRRHRERRVCILNPQTLGSSTGTHLSGVSLIKFKCFSFSNRSSCSLSIIKYLVGVSPNIHVGLSSTYPSAVYSMLQFMYRYALCAIWL